MRNFALILSLSLPVFVSAAGFSGTLGLIQGGRQITSNLILVLSGLAVLVFIWGLVKYIYSQGTDGKADGKKIMVGGVIALFVLFSVYGIIRFIGGELIPGQNMGPISPPQVSL